MLIAFNKPFKVLSQFTDRDGRRTLAEFIRTPGVRAAGRLDYDSEGLLLLTDDGGLQARIADPRHKLPKTYWVQVEGVPGETTLDQLGRGVPLNDGCTRPAQANIIPEPALWPRDPPIRFPKNVPVHGPASSHGAKPSPDPLGYDSPSLATQAGSTGKGRSRAHGCLSDRNLRSRYLWPRAPLVHR